MKLSVFAFLNFIILIFIPEIKTKIKETIFGELEQNSSNYEVIPVENYLNKNFCYILWLN